MTQSCCEIQPPNDLRQKRALILVLGINLLFFVGEGLAGLLAYSSSLLADAVDMGGDALVYLLSLMALSRGLSAKSKVALVNSSFEFILGIGVLIEAISKIFRDVEPLSSTMFIVGGLALLANLTSGWVLMRHRDKDINMRAVWVCTKNDILNNTVTLAAAGLVHLFQNKWPDIIGGMLIAGLISFFSIRMLLEARGHFLESSASETKASPEV